jgi:hypothetical protein
MKLARWRAAGGRCAPFLCFNRLNKFKRSGQPSPLQIEHKAQLMYKLLFRRTNPF